MVRLKSIYLALAIVATIVGCSGATQSSTKQGSKLATVIIGHQPMVSGLPHFVAVQNGYYAEEGLEVTSVKIPTSNTVASQLIEGKIDCSVGSSVVPMLRALKAGQTDPPFKIFSASNFRRDKSFDGILVKTSSPIKDIRDLSGKTVATFPGTTAANFLKYYFKSSYPALPLPILRPTSPELHLQAVETGSVDAVYTYEPGLARAVTSGKLRLIPNSGIFASLQTSIPIAVSAINSQFVKSNPDVAARIVRAVDKGAKFILDHPVEARNILAKVEKLDQKAASVVNDLHMCTSKDLNISVFVEFDKLLKKMGEAGPVPISDKFFLAAK